jgi:hypothetical protein
LSDLLRRALESTDTQEVSLREELDFLSRYSEIEQTRFGDRLRIDMKIAPETLDALVPNLVLHFTLPDEDELRVLLVVPDDAATNETLYFERALGIGKAPTVRIERRRPGTIDAAALASAALVVLWDTPPIGAAMESWVRGGGGAVIVAGRRLTARTGASTLFPGSINGTADRRLS